MDGSQKILLHGYVNRWDCAYYLYVTYVTLLQGLPPHFCKNQSKVGGQYWCAKLEWHAIHEK